MHDVFDKMGPDAVSGQYFLSDVDFDGTCGSLLHSLAPDPIEPGQRGGRTRSSCRCPRRPPPRA